MQHREPLQTGAFLSEQCSIENLFKQKKKKNRSREFHSQLVCSRLTRLHGFPLNNQRAMEAKMSNAINTEKADPSRE